MSKRGRSRGRVVKEVVDPSNPNIIERTYEGPVFPSPSIKKTRQKNQKKKEEEDDEDEYMMDVGDEVDDVLYGGLDFRAAGTSGSQGREPAASRAWRDEARNTERNEDEDIPSAPGLGFLTDAQNGTPMDYFNFESMKRYLERLVKFKTSSIAVFIGGLAMHTNQLEEVFYENGKSPSFLDTNARSLSDLLKTAGLSFSAIIPLMVQVILNQVQSAVKREVELGRVVKSEPLPEDATPLASDEESVVYVSPSRNRLYTVTREEALRRGFEGRMGGDILQTPPRTPAPATVPAQQQGGGVIVYSTPSTTFTGAHIEGSYHWLGHMHKRVQDQPQLIGPNLFGEADLGRNEDDGEFDARNIFRDMRMVLGEFYRTRNSERWIWNSLPENSGIAAIKGTVRYSMEEAWRNIQKLPGKSDIQLYHLVNSPEIRTKFAHYVATLWNVTPGMSLAPGIVSGRGRIIGMRAGQGLIKDQRYANLGRAAYLWFKTVGYKKNPEVTEAEDTLRKIDAEMVRIAQERIDNKRTEILREMRQVWGNIGLPIKLWAAVQFYFDDKIDILRKRRDNASAAIGPAAPADDPIRDQLIAAEQGLAYFLDLKRWMRNRLIELAKTERRGDLDPLEKLLIDRIKPWINVLGTRGAGLEDVARGGNEPNYPRGDLEERGEYWVIRKRGPTLVNWNVLAPLEIGIPKNIPSIIEGDRLDYFQTQSVLEQLLEGLTNALSTVTVWRNPPPQLNSIRTLAYNLLEAFKELHNLRKKKVVTEKFLAELKEEDKVVLTKNQAVRKPKYTSYLKMVPTADDMEGYFPTPPMMLPSSGINWKKVPMFKQGFF